MHRLAPDMAGAKSRFFSLQHKKKDEDSPSGDISTNRRTGCCPRVRPSSVLLLCGSLLAICVFVTMTRVETRMATWYSSSALLGKGEPTSTPEIYECWLA